jgi:hypothetical protein
VEDYITASEFAFLLAVFWFPVFAVAALLQWRLLTVFRKPVIWLLTTLVHECDLAFAIWLSPVSNYFLKSDFLGSFAIGSIPLHAAVIAMVKATVLICVVGHRCTRLTP